jgi:hypothetical protein
VFGSDVATIRPTYAFIHSSSFFSASDNKNDEQEKLQTALSTPKSIFLKNPSLRSFFGLTFVILSARITSSIVSARRRAGGNTTNQRMEAEKP